MVGKFYVLVWYWKRISIIIIINLEFLNFDLIFVFLDVISDEIIVFFLKYGIYYVFGYEMGDFIY